jgi:hypothetical protein
MMCMKIIKAFHLHGWTVASRGRKGTVDPDEFYCHKPTFKLGFRSVLSRKLGEKKVKMVYASGGTKDPTKNITTSKVARRVVAAYLHWVSCSIVDVTTLSLQRKRE